MKMKQLLCLLMVTSYIDVRASHLVDFVKVKIHNTELCSKTLDKITYTDCLTGVKCEIIENVDKYECIKNNSCKLDKIKTFYKGEITKNKNGSSDLMFKHDNTVVQISNSNGVFDRQVYLLSESKKDKDLEVIKKELAENQLVKASLKKKCPIGKSIK